MQVRVIALSRCCGGLAG